MAVAQTEVAACLTSLVKQELLPAGGEGVADQRCYAWKGLSAQSVLLTETSALLSAPQDPVQHNQQFIGERTAQHD